MYLNRDDIARVCHEANRALSFGLHDYSLGTWDMVADWQRDTTTLGVEQAIANPDMTAEECHAAWMAEKLAQGWTYGPLKAPDLLQHPCLLPFDQLPPEQQAKDVLFLAIIKVLAPLMAPKDALRPEVPPVDPPNNPEPNPPGEQGFGPEGVFPPPETPAEPPADPPADPPSDPPADPPADPPENP